jgi:hypothetical protein
MYNKCAVFIFCDLFLFDDVVISYFISSHFSFFNFRCCHFRYFFNFPFFDDDDDDDDDFFSSNYDNDPFESPWSNLRQRKMSPARSTATIPVSKVVAGIGTKGRKMRQNSASGRKNAVTAAKNSTAPLAPRLGVALPMASLADIPPSDDMAPAARYVAIKVSGPSA